MTGGSRRDTDAELGRASDPGETDSPLERPVSAMSIAFAPFKENGDPGDAARLNGRVQARRSTGPLRGLRRAHVLRRRATVHGAPLTAPAARHAAAHHRRRPPDETGIHP
jgi:hypothetical protein